MRKLLLTAIGIVVLSPAAMADGLNLAG